jgi:hypothetical protein
VFLLPLELPPGAHDVRVEFPGGLRQEWRDLVAPEAGEEATYYFRMRRADPGPFDWPPPAMVDEAGPLALRARAVRRGV